MDAARLDRLIDAVGELVIAGGSAALHAAASRNEGVQGSIGEVMRLVEEVRDSALSLRMVPIGTTFSGFGRVVRDVSNDLGSGGGIDVLLSARRVGPTGKAYGLDMTDEMLALARDNQLKAGAENVEFLMGEIESIPLPDNSVDVIISNCVINLSADKDRVLREAFRVLKPGGRFAVSDVVTRGAIPAEVRKDVLLWVGCIAGALDESDYRAKLAAAGFEGVGVEPTRVYKVDDAREFLAGKGLDVDALASEVNGKFMSAFVRATKPQAAQTN